MLAVPVNHFSFMYTNLGGPATTIGTAVTPGASNVEGSWTQIASGANIAQDIYSVLLLISAGATVGQQKDHLVDIGVDPAGSTAYAAIISNIICGQSQSIDAAGRYFAFPIWIKAGSSVAVRIQGNNATAGTALVTAWFFGQPSHPEMVRVGQYSETIGTITNSGGVAFTPGASGAEGTWVSLGTTTMALWWWQLGVQLSAGTVAGRGYHIDLAFGDATNKTMIIENQHISVSASEDSTAIPPTFIQGFCEVPAGAELWVRGSCSGTITAGWNAVAVGIGG